MTLGIIEVVSLVVICLLVRSLELQENSEFGKRVPEVAGVGAAVEVEVDSTIGRVVSFVIAAEHCLGTE